MQPGVSDVMVGREDELAWLRASLSQDPSGVLLIEGEAGIGKTRLLDVALAGVGFRVLRGRAEELEHNRPFGALADALRCGSDDESIRRVLLMLEAGTPAAAGSSPFAMAPEMQFRFVDATVDLVEQLCSHGASVVVVEDVHWADSGTLAALGALARLAHALPLAVVLSTRPVPRMPDLDRLIDVLLARGAQLWRVGPLAPDEVEQLVRSLLRVTPSPELLEQVGAAAGNPLFVIELLRALDHEGVLVVDGEAATVSAKILPPSLRLTILRGLTYLPRETIDDLRLASVLGSAFRLDDLAALAGRPPAGVLRSLDGALRAGVIEERGTRLGFRHDLIRDAVYEELPAAARRTLHRQAATVLIAANAPPAQVAGHMVRGAEPGDDEAVGALRRAATESAPAAPAAAVEMLEHAIGLAGRRHTERDAMRAELAAALVASDRAGEGESLARVILDGSRDAAVATSARRALVQALWVQNRWREAVEQAEQAREQPGFPDEHSAGILADASMGRFWLMEFGTAAGDAREAIELGERFGDAAAVSFATGTLSLVGRFGDEGVVLARRAVEIADAQPDDAAQRRHPRIFLAAALLNAGRPVDALRAIGEGRLIGEELGTVYDKTVYAALAAFANLALGAWDDAAAEANTALALVDLTGTRIGALAAASVLAKVAVHRLDFQAAERAIERGSAELASGPQWAGAEMLDALALLHEARGSFGELAWLAEAPRIETVDRVRQALLISREDLARRAVAVAEERAEHSSSALIRAEALRCRGLCDGDPEALMAAVAAAREAGLPVALGAACEDAGIVLARTGRVDAATPLLQEATSIYDRLGALWDRRRVDETARGSGVRVDVPERRKRPVKGWGALTDTELRVVELVAEGLTNPQIASRLFVSRHTVRTHLAHVFQKMDCATRSELAALAARRLPNDGGLDKELG